MLDTGRYYDLFSARYEEGRHKPYHRFLDLSELAVAGPYCAGREVLEVGCGTGLLLDPLSRLASLAVGVDISRGMVDKALQRGLNVLQGSATSLPFLDDSFDTVVSFKVLPHVKDIGKALRECARVVRPRGYLVLEFYNRRSLRRVVKWLKPAQEVAPATSDEDVFVRYDSLADVRIALPESLRIVKVTGIRTLAPTYHFFNLPIVGPVTMAVERLIQKTPLSQFGGFLVIVAQKRGG